MTDWSGPQDAVEGEIYQREGPPSIDSDRFRVDDIKRGEDGRVIIRGVWL